MENGPELSQLVKVIITWEFDHTCNDKIDAPFRILNYVPLLFIGLQCKVLDDIPNGIVSQTGTTVSSTATYTCNDGFELFGRKTRECLSSGIWSGIEPQCRRKKKKER